MRRAIVHLAPLLLFFAATVGFGVVNALLQSFGAVGPPALDPDLQSRGVLWAYRELFGRPDLVGSLRHSFAVAGLSALGSVVIGAVAGYLVWRAPQTVLTGAYRLPIILPHIVVAWITVLLWARTGLVASIALQLGIDVGAEGFPQLLFAPNGVGMILAYLYKQVPFVMLMVLAVLDRVPAEYATTARMLGARSVRIFGRVILPILAPILNQAFIILFLYDLGGFDVPWLLGAGNPQMISVTVYRLYFQGTLADRAVAMALLTLLALFAIAFVGVYTRTLRRLTPAERAV